MEDTLWAHSSAREDNGRPRVSCAFLPAHPWGASLGRGELPLLQQVDGAQSGQKFCLTQLAVTSLPPRVWSSTGTLEPKAGPQLPGA